MAANPTLLSMPIAENGTKNTIPETQATPGNGLMSQSTGFPAECSLPLGAGGVAPDRADFNGAFNLLGGVAFMAQKGWQFEFDAGQEYFAGCIVRDPTNGLLYECINDVSAGGSVPSADSVNWRTYGVPVGTIISFAGAGLIGGWLNCDGSAVSRTMYSNLFAAIGTTWGAGDGSTTFNLPRSEDLMLQGASTTNPVGTYLSAGLPDITGYVRYKSNVLNGALGGAFSGITSAGSSQQIQILSSSTTDQDLNFKASNANAVYGASNTVQPPAACVRFMIKYE